MTTVKNTTCVMLNRLLLAITLLYFPPALWGAEGTTDANTMIVYPHSRYFTLNAVCFRQRDCEQEVVSLLKNTPGITNVMAYSRQGAIIANFQEGKVKPEDVAQRVAKLMEEKGFGKYELKTTGSQTIPNKLTVRLLPTRVMASSERFT